MISKVYGIDNKNKRDFSLNDTYRVAWSYYRGNGGGDLLIKGAGINADSLEAIVIERFPEIRDLIYENFKNGNLDTLPIYNNWKIIPENIVKSKLARERKLLF